MMENKRKRRLIIGEQSSNGTWLKIATRLDLTDKQISKIIRQYAEEVDDKLWYSMKITIYVSDLVAIKLVKFDDQATVYNQIKRKITDLQIQTKALEDMIRKGEVK